MKKLVIFSLSMLICTFCLADENEYVNPINYFNPDAKITYPTSLKPLYQNGIFVNEDNFLKMKVGLTKAQVKSLFGMPQNSGGLFRGILGSNEWQYVLNIAEGDQAITCQYTVQFDSNSLVKSAYFGDKKCF